MTVAALVVPSAPLLLAEYVGRADPGADIRDRAVCALRDHLVGIDRVVVVASQERSPRHTKGSLAARVAHLLLAAAGWRGPVAEVPVALDATPDEVAAAAEAVGGSTPGRALLVVPADGSAKRTEKAPGHLDSRAAAVDDALLAALGAADASALLALDPALCEEIWLTGRAPLQVLARCFGSQQVTGEVIWSADPFGVLYVIAAWRSVVPE